MQQCSNCGADVREGAKFCTACGSRLNTTSTGTSSGDSTWGTASTPEATSRTGVSTPDTGDDPEQEGTATDQPGSTPAAESSSWLRKPERTADQPQATVEHDDAPVPAPDIATMSQEQDGLDRDDDAPVPAPAAAPEEPSTDAGSPVDRSASTFRWSWQPSGEVADESADASDSDTVAAAVDNAVGEDTPNDANDQDVYTSTVDPTKATDEDASLASWASTWSDPAGRQESSADPLASGGDARARASQLIDELRDLLPAIGATDEEPANGPSLDNSDGRDHRAIVNDLTAARSDLADTSTLRSVLDATRDNPRDINTIVELAGHGDRLVALLDERVRLVAAIDRAIAELG